MCEQRIFNLRHDASEHAQETSDTCPDRVLDRAFLPVPAEACVAQFLQTFVEHPPRQEAASCSLAEVMETLSEGGGARSRAAPHAGPARGRATRAGHGYPGCWATTTP